jgi:DNA (cytosine-5)-methyltransferase 1
MTAYYNENDQFAAAWLRELIKAGHIADGHVDTRSIKEVQPADLRGYTQHHFFAGIGGWSHALRLAGWPDDRPVWTGSCPCQPFSAAGKRAGAADDRHLWPDWFRLVRECRPSVVLGEQVEGAVRLGWLDLVFGDLEGEGYACGAVVFGAHSVGAPHIRQRLYWVADTSSARRYGPLGEPEGQARDEARMRVSGEGGGARGLADADGWLAGDRDLQRDGQHGQQPEDGGSVGGMGNPELIGAGRDAGTRSRAQAGDSMRPVGDDLGSPGSARGLADADLGACGQGRALDGRSDQGSHALEGTGLGGGLGARRPLAPSSFWRDPDWLLCRDDRWRPVESGTFPLVDGAPARLGRLRGYGNAIVTPQAAAFVAAVMSPLSSDKIPETVDGA